MIPSSHAEIEELLGVFALDAVDPDEAEAVRNHLRECPRCRAEVAEHREVAALIAHGGAPAPDGLWDRIAGSLEQAPPALRLAPTPAVVPQPPAPPVDATVVPIEARRNRRGARAALLVAAAAVAVIAVLGTVIVRLNDRVATVEGEMAAIELDDIAARAMADPTARTAQLEAPDGSGSVPAAVTADGAGYLWAAGTPELDETLTYQLWGVVGDQTISLGTFDGGTEVVPFRVTPAVEALAVTTEQSGGVAQSQNDPVYVASI